MRYIIQYTKIAEKFFRKHEKIREQYEHSIQILMIGDHPEMVNVRKIQGKRADYYRIRLGEYRVIYTIINQQVIVVQTLLGGARGDVYKKISGLQ
ncbi:MAG: type II toxin-antitoxin system RelE/ParE family toxin [Bilifractor sp.]